MADHLLGVMASLVGVPWPYGDGAHTPKASYLCCLVSPLTVPVIHPGHCGRVPRRWALAVGLAVVLSVTACASPEFAPPPEKPGLDVTLATVDGEQFDGSSLIGRPVLLWFWAPWCPTCVAEAPDVLDIAREHTDELDVIGVASMGLPQRMRDFVELTQTAELTHLADGDGEFWRLFDVRSQSTYVLLDDAGRVAFSGFATGDELAELVHRVVG